MTGVNGCRCLLPCPLPAAAAGGQWSRPCPDTRCDYMLIAQPARGAVTCIHALIEHRLHVPSRHNRRGVKHPARPRSASGSCVCADASWVAISRPFGLLREPLPGQNVCKLISVLSRLIALQGRKSAVFIQLALADAEDCQACLSCL